MKNKFNEERAKCRNLKFDVNSILDNQYTQNGYDIKEALKCVINYAKNRLEQLTNC